MHPPILSFASAGYLVVSSFVRSVCRAYPGGGDRLRYRNEHSEPKCEYQRWAAEREGCVVTFGDYSQLPWYYNPRTFLLDVVTHPDYQLQSIGPKPPTI